MFSYNSLYQSDNIPTMDKLWAILLYQIKSHDKLRSHAKCSSEENHLDWNMISDILLFFFLLKLFPLRYRQNRMKVSLTIVEDVNLLSLPELTIAVNVELAS